MVDSVFIICMTLLALRCLSSMDKQRDIEILRLKKELKKLGGESDEQGINNKQTGIQLYNGNRK